MFIFKSYLENLPMIPANIIHTCHVGSQVVFSSSEDVLGCSPKLSSCEPKAGGNDILTQPEFKESQELWHDGFCVDMP